MNIYAVQLILTINVQEVTFKSDTETIGMI
jgi:hypothetical protein